jgi:hypothetical protein
MQIESIVPSALRLYANAAVWPIGGNSPMTYFVGSATGTSFSSYVTRPSDAGHSESGGLVVETQKAREGSGSGRTLVPLRATYQGGILPNS